MKTKLLFLCVVLLSSILAAPAVLRAAGSELEPRAYAPIVGKPYVGTPRPEPTPVPTATQPRPEPTAMASACWHPRYDELVDHEGEMVCYEQVYIEHVYSVEVWYPLPDDPDGEIHIECAFLASVFLKEGYVDPVKDEDGNIITPGYWYNDWWAALVWVEDDSGPCEGIWQGLEMPLTAKVLGTQTMAGRTYEDGITIPSLEIQ